MTSRAVLISVAAAALMTVVIGVVDGGRWPHFLVGALLAGVLWLILYCGTLATQRSGYVDPVAYLISVVVALIIGGIVVAIADGGPWWAVGAIVAGLLVPATLQAAGRPQE